MHNMIFCSFFVVLIFIGVGEAWKHKEKYNATAAGTYGVDVSSFVSIEDFKCLKNNGFDFVIVRGYQSICKVQFYPHYFATTTVYCVI